MKTFSKEKLAELNQVYFSLDAPTQAKENQSEKKELPDNKLKEEKKKTDEFILGWEMVDKKTQLPHP